ncbi:FAD-dependent oxidoreductase, partial [Candidatus Bathyarchaeota archaeon]|nr:FAD-dependent oxidoreductase [Candidatus Bathyarchaeota archaeon]
MKTDILIIGGGLVGLSIAFHLARFSTKKILVIDRTKLNYGSSTRNASHFRVHFGAPENTRFAIEAVKRLNALPSLTGWNPIAARDGYVWLIYHEEQ